MSAAPTSNARRRKPFGDDVERTMIGSVGSVRWAPSMIWSGLSPNGSRPKGSGRDWARARETLYQCKLELAAMGPRKEAS